MAAAVGLFVDDGDSQRCRVVRVGGASWLHQVESLRRTELSADEELAAGGVLAAADGCHFLDTSSLGE